MAKRGGVEKEMKYKMNAGCKEWGSPMDVMKCVSWNIEAKISCTRVVVSTPLYR